MLMEVLQISWLLISKKLAQKMILSISAVRTPFVMKIREKWGNYPIFNPIKFGRYCVSGSTSNQGISMLLISQDNPRKRSSLFPPSGMPLPCNFKEREILTPFDPLSSLGALAIVEAHQMSIYAGCL